MKVKSLGAATPIVWNFKTSFFKNLHFAHKRKPILNVLGKIFNKEYFKLCFVNRHLVPNHKNIAFWTIVFYFLPQCPQNVFFRKFLRKRGRINILKIELPYVFSFLRPNFGKYSFIWRCIFSKDYLHMVS